MRNLLCSLPVLVLVFLAAGSPASAQTEPGTPAVIEAANDSALAGGTTLIAAPAPLDSALDQVPEPVALAGLPVTCYAYCDGEACPASTCNGTLAFCCAASRRMACQLHGGEYSGSCTDGTSWLVC